MQGVTFAHLITRGDSRGERLEATCVRVCVCVCIPKGTTSYNVVRKVVWYLKEKADAEDMKASAVSIVGPVLTMLYNCTPGQPPKLSS